MRRAAVPVLAATLVVSCGGAAPEAEAPPPSPFAESAPPVPAPEPAAVRPSPPPPAAPPASGGPSAAPEPAGPPAVPSGLVPGGLARGGDEPADQELVQGDRAYRAGDYKTARQHYAAAAKLAPRDPAPKVGLVRVRVASGEVPTEHASGPKNPKVKALLAEVDTILRANPDYGPAYVERGRLLLVQDKPEAALAALERGAALTPDDPEAQSSLGIALLATGKPDAALERLARASAVDPDDPDRLTNLGTALMMRGRVQDAIVAYRRAVELAPNDPVGLSDLATAYLSAARPEDAKPLIEKAVSLAPDRATFLSNLGYTQHQLKDLPAALATLKLATQKDPKLGSAWINLGDVYVDQGQLEEAERAFKRALELDKTDPRAQASWNDFVELKRKLGK